MHTWLRGPLKYRDAPLPFVSSLRDFDSELIHAVCHQGVYQDSPLGAFPVFPARWLTFFSEPNCVGSGLRQNNIFLHFESPWFSLARFLAIYMFFQFTYPVLTLQVSQASTRSPTLFHLLWPSPFQLQGPPRRRALTVATWPWHWCPGLHILEALRQQAHI